MYQFDNNERRVKSKVRIVTVKLRNGNIEDYENCSIEGIFDIQKRLLLFRKLLCVCDGPLLSGCMSY